MKRHVVWAFTVCFLSTLAALVALVISGHEAPVRSLGGIVGAGLGVAFWVILIAWFFGAFE